MQSERGAQLIAEDIIKEAREEAERIVAEARKEAEATLEAAKITAKETEEARLREAERMGAAEMERILSEGRLRIKKEILRRREELIESVFARARKELEEHVRSRKYEEDLVRIVKKAVKGIGARKVVVRTNRRDLGIIEREKRTIERETGASLALGDPIIVTGGVRVVAPDLRVELDETFEGRLAREMESLRVKVAETLFKD
ncbi:MAG: V-type ATP synthase subunit E family protein [Candidatus Hadarchaeales archaeon]